MLYKRDIQTIAVIGEEKFVVGHWSDNRQALIRSAADHVRALLAKKKANRVTLKSMHTSSKTVSVIYEFSVVTERETTGKTTTQIQCDVKGSGFLHADVAKEIGMSLSNFGHMLRGDVKPRIDFEEQVMDAIDRLRQRAAA